MSDGTSKWKTYKPYKTRIFVKKYTKPEKIGALFVAPAYMVDNSRALWEVVTSSPKADEYIGLNLGEGDLLITLPNRGTYVGFDDEQAEIYSLFAEEIVKYIQRNW